MAAARAVAMSNAAGRLRRGQGLVPELRLQLPAPRERRPGGIDALGRALGREPGVEVGGHLRAEERSRVRRQQVQPAIGRVDGRRFLEDQRASALEARRGAGEREGQEQPQQAVDRAFDAAQALAGLTLGALRSRAARPAAQLLEPEQRHEEREGQPTIDDEERDRVHEPCRV